MTNAEKKAKKEAQAAIQAEAKAEAGALLDARAEGAQAEGEAKPKSPKAEDVLGLNGLTAEDLLKKAMGLDEDKIKAMIIAGEQEKRQNELIEKVKAAFTDVRYPFAAGEKIIVTVFPMNGDYSVQLSKAAQRKTSKGNSAWRIIDPNGEEVVAESAAAYCRDRLLDPKGASAVSFLRGKGYTVEEVA